LPWTNPLAYYKNLLITEEKSFITLVPGNNLLCSCGVAVEVDDGAEVVGAEVVDVVAVVVGLDRS
jgi:hypothetical protein